MASKKKKHSFKAENKLVVTFDPQARKEFLTGFRKRKLQRRTDAHNKIEEMQREERLAARKRKREEIQEKVDKLFNRMEEAAGPSTQVNMFKSPEELVTVTTVSYGFGNEDDSDEANVEDEDDEGGEHKPKRAAIVKPTPKGDSQPAPKPKPLPAKKKKGKRKSREKGSGKKGNKGKNKGKSREA